MKRYFFNLKGNETMGQYAKNYVYQRHNYVKIQHNYVSKIRWDVSVIHNYVSAIVGGASEIHNYASARHPFGSARHNFKGINLFGLTLNSSAEVLPFSEYLPQVLRKYFHFQNTFRRFCGSTSIFRIPSVGSTGVLPFSECLP